jgi:hypothetical protein
VVSLYHFHCVIWRLTCLSIVFWSSRTRATSESGSMAPLDRRCVQKTSHNVTLITTIPGTHKNKEKKNLKWTNNYYCVINNSASKFSKTAITNNIWKCQFHTCPNLKTITLTLNFIFHEKKSNTQLASHVMVYIWLCVPGRHYAVLKPVRNSKYAVVRAIIPF